MITNIDINKIDPHPDNPRKDLGDLSELADSIKANGILQNLTVVPRLAMRPGYCTSCNLYNGAVGKCRSDYDKNERPPCSKWEVRDDFVFTVIIGHRRLAAAKLAGLTEVPCVISDMDSKKQISIMLLENMQRNDLTIWEQAQGFQMLLQFGDTINYISTKTGFSESTIRRRVKLLELDGDKFRQSVARGATLQDYAELDKIKDVKIKNSVLEKIGTSDFRWSLQRAIDKEKTEEIKAAMVEEFKKFATQVEKRGELRCINWFHYSNSAVKIPADADSKKYYFLVGEYSIELLVETENVVGTKNSTAAAEEQQQLQERRAKLDELHKRAYQLRLDFVRNYAGRQKDVRSILELVLKAMLMGELDGYYLHNEICKVLGIEIPETEDEDDCDDDESMAEAEIFKAFEASPEKVLFVTAYLGLEDDRARYCDWQGKFSSHSALDALYDALERLGYEMSNEERALRDGTHELYVCGAGS